MDSVKQFSSEASKGPNPLNTPPLPRSLGDLLALNRPVTIREVTAALPFLKQSTLVMGLRAKRIPGHRVGRLWLIKREYLLDIAGENERQ